MPASWNCCAWSCYDKYPGPRRVSIAEATKKLSSVPEFLPNNVPYPKAKYLRLTFLPDVIINGILKNSFEKLPCQIQAEAVVLICDVCNFTRITESYCQKGVLGIEELASILNGYMSTLAALMLAAGGDILNFAGDAFLVLWEIKGTSEDKLATIKRAYNCAVALQAHQSLQDKNLDGMLKVKIGIGVGKVDTWVLGSDKFVLFVVSGPALPIAHHAESMCSAGDIIVSKEVYVAIQVADVPTFDSTPLLEGYVRICNCESVAEADLCPVRDEQFYVCEDKDLVKAKIFLIPSIREVRTAAELNYLSELTMVTILFISLPDIEVEEPRILEETFNIILDCAKNQGGAFNKMLLFDKGCTYLVVFGLPGQKHSNDAVRALLCAHDIVDRHLEINVNVSVGVTSGTCFCGLVGHPQRQEYTVIGSRVNLAARLMVAYSDDGIVLDADTFYLSRDVLGETTFTELPVRKMKGVQNTGKIYACRIKREERTLTSESAISIFDEQLMEEIGDEKKQVRNCLTALSNAETRSNALSNTLLPVIIFEGASGYGKNYFLYSGVLTAMQLGYKAICCCAIPSSVKDPFSTAALLVQRMLKFRGEDTLSQRESKILNALPEGYDSHLYLFNYLFHVQFPHPKLVNIDQASRNFETIRLFMTIFRKFSMQTPTVFAIDEADYMDERSWILIHQLADESNYVIFLGLSPDFKKPFLSTSILYLKAITHINVDIASHNYFSSLACWFLGVAGIYKGLISYLKEKTECNAQLLQEVLLSPTITECTIFIPFNCMSKELLVDFYISEFLSENDKKNDSVMVCVLKPGVQLTNTSIPATINDAVQDCLNYLTVQDRLLLKRASLLGPDFDQHLLESVSPGLTSEEVTASINKLMSKNVFVMACSSDIILERLPNKYKDSESMSVKCYDVCYCHKVTDKFIFQNRRVQHLKAGPYGRMVFRLSIFRQIIRSYMTNEQFNKMHIEIVNELETNGLICVSCRNKRLENLESKMNKGDMRATHLQIDVKQCTCLQRRPKLYMQISSLYCSVGLKLLPVFYVKKAAEASNRNGYPIEGLYYANAAEDMLPPLLTNAIGSDVDVEEAHFDPVALRAAIQKSKARSALLLGNYYYAASYVQKALSILGLDTIHFYGVYSETKFKENLQSCHHRLANHDLILNVLEIGEISKAYISLIRRNFHKADLGRAKVLAEEALSVLARINDQTNMVTVYIKLIEIYLHANNYSSCFAKLQKIPPKLEGSDAFEINMLYHCALASVMIKKLKAEGTSKTDEENIKKCNDFACEWTKGKSCVIKNNLAFYGSTVFALWISKSRKHCKWLDADSAFFQCFDLATELYKKQDKESYWGIKGSLNYMKIQMVLLPVGQDSKEELSSILKKLEKMKGRIKSHFPVCFSQYESLKHDIFSRM